jgi:hypothetical protein
MRALIFAWLVGAVMLVAPAACVTPSIPIPPPDPAKMTFSFEGLGGPESRASFAYPPDGNYIDSIVFVYNRDRGVGVIENAHPDGSVGPTAPIGADVGEQVVVTFEREDQTVSTCIRLREGAQSPFDFCGP